MVTSNDKPSTSPTPLSDDDPRHGTTNGYVNRKCRCESCREAWRVSCATRSARRSLTPDDPRHGTYNGYTNYRCRCEPCRTANRERARSLADLAAREQTRPVKRCAVDDCDKASRSRGYCETHYVRWRKYGDPLFVTAVSDRRRRPHSRTYNGIHLRLKRERGPAREHACVECGGQARHWSYDHGDPEQMFFVHSSGHTLPFSLDPDHYQPRCGSCHRKKDGMLQQIRNLRKKLAAESAA